MSNLWLNVRLLYWHLQIGPDRPWVRLSFNEYHIGNLWRPFNRSRETAIRSPWFEVY